MSCDINEAEMEDAKADYCESQLESMREWFFENFENPLNTGHGIGNYDAYEVLENMYSGIMPDEYITELAEELNEICSEWAAIPSLEDYDVFDFAIKDIESLLKTSCEISAYNCLYRLLYANVITVIETYLSSTFSDTVLSNSNIFRRFIETTPDFKKKTVLLADVFKEIEEIKKEIEEIKKDAEIKAKEHLDRFIWHNLKNVILMYKDTLLIEFPKEITVSLGRAISKRHDIVHRNGKTKKGDDVLIQIYDVIELINTAKTLKKYIDECINELKCSESSPDFGESVFGNFEFSSGK